MTVSDGKCDYCARERLLETGDERSRVQRGKLWCGTCRGGSEDRYQGLDNHWLEAQIAFSEEMLAQHPIVWEGDRDHFRMHLFKLDVSDEVWRMKRELEYRKNDG